MWTRPGNLKAAVRETPLDPAIGQSMPARVAVSWYEPGYHPRRLECCARRLDGRPAAAATTRRKCAVLASALGYAAERRRQSRLRLFLG